jgi:hypothetical protein
MATKSTKAAPKAKVEAPAEEVKVEATPQGVRPNDLAKELGVDGKRIRGFLRQEFTRPLDAKNSSWFLTDTQVAAVKERFAPKSDDSDES